MLIILFVSFVILLLIGAPIAYSMGFSSLLALILSGSTFPLEVVVQRTFSMLNSYSLLAIPFFILAGDLMSAGGISKRLIKFATAAVGHLPPSSISSYFSRTREDTRFVSLLSTGARICDHTLKPPVIMLL